MDRVNLIVDTPSEIMRSNEPGVKRTVVVVRVIVFDPEVAIRHEAMGNDQIVGFIAPQTLNTPDVEGQPEKDDQAC